MNWQWNSKNCHQATEMEADKPVSGIHDKWSRLNVPPNNHPTRRTINTWHLHTLRAGVCPVEIACYPVNDDALRWFQVKVNHLLQHASVHERTVNALRQHNAATSTTDRSITYKLLITQPDFIYPWRSETYIRRSLFSSSVGSCHGGDVTWQEISRMCGSVCSCPQPGS